MSLRHVVSHIVYSSAKLALLRPCGFEASRQLRHFTAASTHQTKGLLIEKSTALLAPSDLMDEHDDVMAEVLASHNGCDAAGATAGGCAAFSGASGDADCVGCTRSDFVPITQANFTYTPSCYQEYLVGAWGGSGCA